MLVRQYVQLQFKLIQRHLVELGIRPVWGYILVVAGFTGLSFVLFERTEFARYLYLALAIAAVQALNAANRIDFLKNCFSKKDYLVIRATEIILVTFPFLLFLIYKGEYALGLLILPAAFLTNSLDGYKKLNFTLKTPFYKHPFEFAVGFRKSFLIVTLSYLLVCIAIGVTNFNLGMFAIITLYFISLTYYTLPEAYYYVWIFSGSEKGFLAYKIKIALLYSLMLSLPAVLALVLAFPDRVLYLAGIMAFGSLVLIASILGKYSAYPAEINIPQGLGIAFCILFPPALLLILPIFYMKSIKQLKPLFR